MSKKNYDNHNRWRNKTVAFRVSAEEWKISPASNLAAACCQEQSISCSRAASLFFRISDFPVHLTDLDP